MKRLIGILLLFTVNTAMAQFGQAIENYRQNQANQNNQNGQTSTSTNTVIYGTPQEQQLAAPRARAAAHKGNGVRNNHSNRTRNHNRGNGTRNR